jgi:glycogen(starch) synthase
VEWWLAYEAWRAIACSQYMAWEVQTYFHVPADKVDVIANGVDTARFDRWHGADLADFRLRYARPDEKIVFYVGRVVYEKGLQVLVDAVPKVLAEFPQAKFVIAGTGGMLGELRHRVQERGLAGKVLFTGYIADGDRDRLLALSSCVVFPSLYEPFGIVALEAMASRAPVVVSAVGGLAEVVTHAETGITTYPGNSDSLAWGILHTLQEPAWAKQRADVAYQMVVEQYNWARIARQTIDVYERIISERAEAVW